MATQKRNALGRGLDALLSMDDVKTEGSSSISEIELAKITVNPNQPRREFDQTALQELADSIAEIGIIIRMRLANQKISQVIDNLLLPFTFHLIVQHSHMNIADNPAAPMFLEVFAELVLVHRCVQINRMDVIKILSCRSYSRPFRKFLLCHNFTYFIR